MNEMANNIYVKITGLSQGDISAGCGTYDSLGNKYQANHRDQILVLQLDHLITREQKVNHHAINFFKPIDKSSPLLAMALDSDERLELIFDMYRTSRFGTQELFYTVEARRATLSKISIVYPHSIDHSDRQPEEMISVLYRDITWKHHSAGTSGYSIWDERAY
ncbi:Hcp family secreted protein [Buttiauxella gaviniae ATCC 51604]|uniref:Hcp family secreted protein n=2 Tax=Buttiauxella gaviniae TaxID=82990 RepID=A0A1B7I5L2_9ENTR|nr:Hcp family secreted protein [Buttiauxella gaviniae ATCC 51604]